MNKLSRPAYALLLLFCVLPAFAFSVYSKELPNGQFATGSVAVVDSCGTGVEENLSEDDGAAESSADISETYSLSCIAPTTYPSVLIEVSASVFTGTDTDFNLAVFAGSETTGPSGSPIWVSPAIAAAINPDWYTVDLTLEPEFQDFAITSGAWCFGVFDSDVEAGPEIDIDTTTPGGRSFSGTPGDWTSQGGVLNYLVRSVATDCPETCACFIDGQCYAEGELNPESDCQICDPDTDIAAWTDDNSSCADNGLFCDGAEVCSAGSCVSEGDPCDDGVSCTNDSCDEENDLCDFTPDDSLCDNGDWCDGDETCDATNDCQAGTAPDCNDSVSCTVDFCDETNDACANIPDNSICDNGIWCDGTETCNAVNDCQPGTMPDCDDGIGCTDDTCDEINDTCLNDANDANCDNGDWCDGEERCSATEDCQSGEPPCDPLLEACNEGSDSCISLTDDDDDDDDDDTTDDDDDTVSDDDDTADDDAVDDDDDDTANDDDDVTDFSDDDDDSSGFCG